MNVPKPSSRRLLAFVAAAALACGIVACGDSDDGNDNDASKPSAAATTTTEDENAGNDRKAAADKPRSTSGPNSEDGANTPDENPATPPADAGKTEEERVADIVSGMYEDFGTSDAKGVCGVMSEAAREQIGKQAIGGSGSTTCEANLAKLFQLAAASGTLEEVLKTSVRGVSVNGDAAKVTIALGNRSGKIRLVKEDGEWRFSNAPLGPTGRQ